MSNVNFVNSGDNREMLAREVVQALTLAYHRLTRAADALHGEGEITTGLRSVLLRLDEDGPATASALARARGVSRQFMQRLVDQLIQRGWAQATANPRHRRSPLLALTTEGRVQADAIRGAEAPWWRRLGAELDQADLEATLRTLAVLAPGTGSAEGRS